jgi:hypothetical protein
MVLFPTGILHYLIGGLLAGIGISLVYIFIGFRAGASSVFSSTWSFFSKLPYFQQDMYVKQRVWRLVFALGTVGGGLLFLFGLNKGEAFTTNVQWWRLLLGGFFIGIGARLSRGCTSGHGICGLSSFSFRSLSAVITFMLVAIFVAGLVSYFGVSP